MKEEGRGGGSELGSDLDPDPWKTLWIRQHDADPLDPDPDPQHWLKWTSSTLGFRVFFNFSITSHEFSIFGNLA